MTIRRNVNIDALNDRYNYLERCAEKAPDGTYALSKATVETIGEIADDIMRRVRALGLRANNCDGIREVEAVIYGYVADANPDSELRVGEGFGEHVDGPAGERVLAQAVRDRDFIRNHPQYLAILRGEV